MKRIVLATAVAFACLAAPQMRAAEQQKPESLVKTLIRQAPGLRGEVLRLALAATERAADQGLVKRRDLLTVIDYSLPSSQPRLFVFNLVTRKLLFRELVAHGKNSGDDRATYFSNSPGSLATSLGLFVTAATYVSRAAISALGRLGRSWGCPAVRKEIAKKMIDTLRGGSPIFAYYPEHRWLDNSSFVHAEK